MALSNTFNIPTRLETNIFTPENQCSWVGWNLLLGPGTIFKALHPFISKWVNEIHTGSDWTPPCVAWAHHSLGFSKEFVPSTPAIVVFLPKDPLHIPHTARREIFSSVTRTSWQSESGEYPPWSLRLPSLKRTAQPSNGCLQNGFPFFGFRAIFRGKLAVGFKGYALTPTARDLGLVGFNEHVYFCSKDAHMLFAIVLLTPHFIKH